MPRWLFWTILAVLLGAVVFLWAGFPRINVVETGRTPEYPELQPKDFAASEKRVLEAAQSAAEALPGWKLVGAGSGPTGSHLRANATSRLVFLTSEVVVTIRRTGGRTRVTVKSQSKPPLDLGRNAQHVRDILTEMERRLGAPPPAAR